MKRTVLIFFCLSIVFVGQSQTSGDNNRNVNYYYADGKAHYWQDDSTSANIIVTNKHNYDAIVKRLLNIFNENEVVYDNEDDNIIINSENLPNMDKDSLIELISVENNDISFFTYSKLVDGEHLWLRNEVYVSFSDTAYFRNYVKPILNNYSVLSYNYEDYNEFRIVCADEWDMMLLANTVAKMEGVEYSTPDFYSNIVTNANDAFYNDQWGVNNTGQYEYTSTVGVDINADLAWAFLDNNVANISNNIKVAVVDDGVEPHEDFYYEGGVCKVLSGYTANGDGTGQPRTRNAHGQCCAGIIGAVHNNIGTAGIAPRSLIIPFRIFKNNGRAFSNARIARAINKAWNEFGTDVLSCSWGGGLENDNITNAIHNALDSGRYGKGCIVVFAAGNNDVSSVAYPANSDSRIITVGAISPCGERKSPTSCDGEIWPGRGSSYGSKLDVVAPGVFISTIDRSGNYGYNYSGKENDYFNRNYTKFFGGTSAACPHVAGVAALLLSYRPNLMGYQVKQAIERTARKIGQSENRYTYIDYSQLNNPQFMGYFPNGSWNTEVGYGLVDAYAALMYIDSLFPSADLYVRDNASDNGNEPNLIEGNEYYNSPDIWLEDPSAPHHNFLNRVINPKPGKTYKLRVRVHNKSNVDSEANKTLSLRWTIAGTPLMWRSSWFDPTRICGDVKSDEIATLSLPIIPANSSIVVSTEWTVPSFEGTQTCMSLPGATWRLSIAAVLEDGHQTSGIDATALDMNLFAATNNNVAWKNYTVLSKETPVAMVTLKNPFSEVLPFDLKFEPANVITKEMLDEYVDVYMVLSDELMQAWKEGGGESDNLEEIEGNRFRLISSEARLKNIVLEKNAELPYAIEIVYKNFMNTEEPLELKMTQMCYKSEQVDSVLSGLTYYVYLNEKFDIEVDAKDDAIALAGDNIQFTAESGELDAVFTWYNMSGDSIGNGNVLNVQADQTQQYYLRGYSSTVDAYGYDSVVLVVRNGAITAITPNPATNQAVVSYTLSNQVQNGTIQIANNNGIVLQSIPFTNAQTSTTLNLQNLVAGQYSVRLVSGIGEVLDTKTLIVQ